MYQAPRSSQRNHQKELKLCFLLKKMQVSHLSSIDLNTLLWCNPAKIFKMIESSRIIIFVPTILTSDIESKLAIVKSNPTYRGSPKKKSMYHICTSIYTEIFINLPPKFGLSLMSYPSSNLPIVFVTLSSVPADGSIGFLGASPSLYKTLKFNMLNSKMYFCKV